MAHGSLTRVITRRGFVGASAILAASAAAGNLAAQSATPAASPASPAAATPVAAASTTPYLLLTDRNEPTLWFYSIPDGTLTGKLENILVASHGSAFTLPDGRTIIGTLNDQAIKAIVVNDAGVPEIVASVPATFGESAAWIVTDPAFTYLAFGSLKEGDIQTLNVVDLATFTNTELEFELNEPEEVTAWLLGDPLHLYVSVGGRIDSYDLATVLGGDMTPLGSEEVDLGSHGGATDAANNQILYVTGPGFGMDVLDVSSGVATWVTQIPWDIDGLTGGYNPRPAVTSDGGNVVGVVYASTEVPEEWADVEGSFHIVSTAEHTGGRHHIGYGAFTTRWGTGGNVAIAPAYNADGGFAYIIDADAASATFGEVINTIEIPVPSNGLVPGEYREDAEIYYVAAVSPDGAWGFVTIPGDGKVEIIDIAAGTIVGEITAESSLSGFGYSKVIQAGITPVDLWGR